MSSPRGTSGAHGGNDADASGAAGRQEHPVLKLQRDALRRLREADAARHRTEEAAAAHVARARQEAAAGVSAVEGRSAEALKQAGSALPAARNALTRVKMMHLLDAPVRFRRGQGEPETELATAVAAAREASAAVSARVRDYEAWLADRRVLQGAFLAAVALVLVVVMVRLADDGTSPGVPQSATAFAAVDSTAVTAQSRDGVATTGEELPTRGEEEKVPAFVETAIVPPAQEDPQQPAREPDEPEPGLYEFARRDLQAAQDALDRGAYLEVRRGLRDTYARLERIGERFPRSRAIQELKGNAIYLIERAGTACQAERLTDEERGETPRDCN